MYMKKMLRELKENKVRYAIIFLILAVGLMMVIGNVTASSNVADQMDAYFSQYKAESGEFTTAAKLTEDEIEGLEDLGAAVEEQFYIDCSQPEDVVLRVYEVRENINEIKLMEGNLPEKDSEVVLENSYALAKNIEVGGKIRVGGKTMTVCGIGTVPDYVSIKKNITDLNADTSTFGLCFVTEQDYEDIRQAADGEKETLQYAYILNGSYTDDDVKSYIEDTGEGALLELMGIDSNLLMLNKASENGRMTGYQADNQTIMSVAVMMGLFLAILFAFIIAVFIVHNINAESVAIGTLYALGVSRGKVLKQYMLLPVLILLAGGAAGLILGYLLCGASIANSGAAYSYPVIEHHFYPVAIVYAIVLPVALGVLINLLVINIKLRKRPLELIRGSQSSAKTPKLKLKKGTFVSIYRIRQLMREKAIYLLTLLGVFYAICIMMFAFTIYSAMDNYVTTCTDDVKWEYMYTVNGADLADAEDAEEALSKKVSASNVYSGEDTDLTLLGLKEDSKYFDLDLDCEKDEIVISDCAARKFAWKVGDEITLKNKSDSAEHTFTVKAVADYSASLFVFLPEDEMRQAYDLDDDYNTVFSTAGLSDDDETSILTTTRRADIKQSADTLMDTMMLTVAVMLLASVVVFIAVLYLLLKQAIEKSSFGISVMQIFGYGQKEINRIFINVNFVIVVVAVLCALLFGKPVIDNMYPNLVTDIDLGFDTGFSAAVYVILLAVIAAAYGISMALLKRRLSKMSYAELLKNRD